MLLFFDSPLFFLTLFFSFSLFMFGLWYYFHFLFGEPNTQLRFIHSFSLTLSFSLSLFWSVSLAQSLLLSLSHNVTLCKSGNWWHFFTHAIYRLYLAHIVRAFDAIIRKKTDACFFFKISTDDKWTRHWCVRVFFLYFTLSLILSLFMFSSPLSSCHLFVVSNRLCEHEFDDHIPAAKRLQNYGCFKSSSEKITHHFHHFVFVFFFFLLLGFLFHRFGCILFSPPPTSLLLSLFRTLGWVSLMRNALARLIGFFFVDFFSVCVRD